jgi:ribosomal protein L37E
VSEAAVTPTTSTTPAVTPYCRRCGEQLLTLNQPSICGACGLQYDPARPETYATHRSSSRWKFWLPGFLLSVLIGTLTYAGCLQSGATMGWALFVAVPICFGAILGYACRLQTWAFAVLGILAIATVIFVLISQSLAGIFCGFTLGIIFLVPTFLGLLCGIILRMFLVAGKWDHAWYFRWYVWLIAALPLIGQQIEDRIPRRTEIAVIKTGLTIDSTPEEAWNAIMFYEDVEHAPPWLLHLALPQPIRSEGSKQKEGEIVTCFYNCGEIKKRISKVDAPRKLAFDVVGIQMRSENYARLKDGSFEIEPLGDKQCRITLTTRFERKLQPAFFWEPIEHKVIHTLHGHVLEGMRRKAEGPKADHKLPPPYEKQDSKQYLPRVVMSGGPPEFAARRDEAAP